MTPRARAPTSLMRPVVSRTRRGRMPISATTRSRSPPWCRALPHQRLPSPVRHHPPARRRLPARPVRITRILLYGRNVMSSALETLRRDFGGDIIEPGGAEYESASRSVLASGSPACVLRPRSAGDVQAGVGFAAGAGLLLSVRGGASCGSSPCRAATAVTRPAPGSHAIPPSSPASRARFWKG